MNRYGPSIMEKVFPIFMAFEFARKRTARTTDRKTIVQAPQPSTGKYTSGAVLSVSLAPDEEAEWHWAHYRGEYVPRNDKISPKNNSR